MVKLLDIFKEQRRLKIAGNIYHKTQIELAYNSNRIEGSSLSEEQTRYIYETKTVDGTARVNDIIEMQNHFRLFDYMLDTAKEPLDEKLIKHYHQILKANTLDSDLEYFKVGDYKTLPNEVGGKITVSPEDVPAKINDLILNYISKSQTTFEDIVDFHYQFECIHPFQDGNGRVGRMIMFKECLKNDIIPFIIQEQYKMFYYRGLANYEKEKGFLMDTCLNAQDIYQKYIEVLLPDFNSLTEKKRPLDELLEEVKEQRQTKEPHKNKIRKAEELIK